MFDGFQNSGFGHNDTTTDSDQVLDTNWALFKVGDGFSDGDYIPKVCQIADVEIYMSSIAGGATTATMAIFRDVGGDYAVVDYGASGATKTISVGKTTATDGSVVFPVGKDLHPMDGVTEALTSVTDTSDARVSKCAPLYVGIKLNAGAAVAVEVRLNWRSPNSPS